MKTALAAILMLCSLAARADDAYALWSNGHPREALPGLQDNAIASDRWDAWFDLGLAAAASGDRGRACAWLLRARERAPERPEPREALLALGASLPPSWIERIGPLAVPGRGWLGCALMLVAGLGIGYAIFAKRWRQPAACAGILALCAALPGEAAAWADARIDLIAVVNDTQLLDSTGQAKQPLAAGTILVRESPTPWSQRWQVHLLDGHRGFVPIPDTDPKL